MFLWTRGGQFTALEPQTARQCMFTGPRQLFELVRQSARECSLMLFTKRLHNNRVSNKNRIIFKSLQLGYTMTQKNDPYIKMCSTLYGVGLRLFGVLNFIAIKYFCTSLVKPFYAENNNNVPLKCNRAFMFCNLSFFYQNGVFPISTFSILLRVRLRFWISLGLRSNILRTSAVKRFYAKNKQDAQLSQRDRAAGCVIVFAKSRTLERGDNDLRIL